MRISRGLRGCDSPHAIIHGRDVSDTDGWHVSPRAGTPHCYYSCMGRRVGAVRSLPGGTRTFEMGGTLGGATGARSLRTRRERVDRAVPAIRGARGTRGRRAQSARWGWLFVSDRATLGGWLAPVGCHVDARAAMTLSQGRSCDVASDALMRSAHLFDGHLFTPPVPSRQRRRPQSHTP